MLIWSYFYKVECPENFSTLAIVDFELILKFRDSMPYITTFNKINNNKIITSELFLQILLMTFLNFTKSIFETIPIKLKSLALNSKRSSKG